MTAISEFFDRFDAMKPAPDDLGIESAAVTDDEMAEASASMMPIYSRLGDRADLDVGDLLAETNARMQVIPAIVVARTIAGAELIGEIRAALVNVATENFLAGVLWEQAKQLPEVDDVGGGS